MREGERKGGRMEDRVWEEEREGGRTEYGRTGIQEGGR